MKVTAQIKALEATRAAKVAQMEKLGETASEADRTMDSAEAEEFDGLGEEIKKIDAELVRMRTLESFNGQKSRPVVDPTTTEEPSVVGSKQRSSGPHIIVASKDQDEKFKGQNFTRIAIAKALGYLNGVSPGAIAERRWGKTNPTLVAVIKANEVAGGGTGSGEWGAELVQADTRYTGDFIEFLYSKTLYDQLPLRQVPANVAIKGQDGAATGYWVGESKAIPVSKADFSTVNLTPLKVAALAVVSNELLRDSTPAAEGLVRDALVEASSQRVDLTFVSNAAASAGVSPAGILNGLSSVGTAGSSAEDVRLDILALYAPFIAAKNASGLVFATDPATRKSLQMLTTAFGQVAFPELGAGNLLGDAIYASDNITAGNLLLIKPSDIWRIGDDGVQVDISRDAMIEQNSAPTGATDTPVAASVTMVSMFQENSTAIRVIRSINFAKRRASAVSFLSGASYGGTSP